MAQAFYSLVMLSHPSQHASLGPTVMQTIPLHHAGLHVSSLAQPLATSLATAKDGEPVLIDGQHYSVFNHYLVPRYAPMDHELNRRSEQLVLDRVKRFFYSAEKGLDIPWTRENIEREIRAFQACNDPDLKAIKGRHLAGAMVNRMARLAQIILQENIIGIDIEITHTQGDYTVTQAQLDDLRVEFREDYIFLVGDEDLTPVQYVRRQNGSADHDGFLLDLVREMGKPLLMNAANETYLFSGLLQKIGYAMEAIDEVRHALQPLLDSALMQPVRGEYISLFDELTVLCRARSGLRAQDRDSFGPVRERIAQLDERLRTACRRLDYHLSAHGYLKVHRLQFLLQEAVELMQDIAVSRYPRNHRCNENPREQDSSSVGRLTKALHAFAAEEV